MKFFVLETYLGCRIMHKHSLQLLPLVLLSAIAGHSSAQVPCSSITRNPRVLQVLLDHQLAAEGEPQAIEPELSPTELTLLRFSPLLVQEGDALYVEYRGTQFTLSAEYASGDVTAFDAPPRASNDQWRKGILLLDHRQGVRKRLVHLSVEYYGERAPHFRNLRIIRSGRPVFEFTKLVADHPASVRTAVATHTELPCVDSVALSTERTDAPYRATTIALPMPAPFFADLVSLARSPATLPLAVVFYQSSSSDNHYKYAGQELDDESGLYHMGARYYGSGMGRFMTPDLLGGHLEDPQTLNKYAYVRNNPINLTDPTGLDFNLTCTTTKDNASTCQGGHVGTTTTDANGNSTFAATVVTSASLADPKSGNTATVNENGTQITTAEGTFQGAFISNTPAADIQGSGKLRDFSFHIDGNCDGTCLSAGSFKYNGNLSNNGVRNLLYDRGSFSITGEDFKAYSGIGVHAYTTQHRFGGPDYSPHLSVPLEQFAWFNGVYMQVERNPAATVPVTGSYHVDAHSSVVGHAVDVFCGHTGLCKGDQ